MTLPILVVGEDDPIFPDKGAAVGRDLLSPQRGSLHDDCRRPEAKFAKDARTCLQLSSAASMIGCIRKNRVIGRCRFAKGTIAAAKAAVPVVRFRREELGDELGMFPQQHRERPGPNAVRILFPER